MRKENVNCMQGEFYRLMPSIIDISLNETQIYLPHFTLTWGWKQIAVARSRTVNATKLSVSLTAGCGSLYLYTAVTKTKPTYCNTRILLLANFIR
jgi:hypothetical protein